MPVKGKFLTPWLVPQAEMKRHLLDKLKSAEVKLAPRPRVASRPRASGSTFLSKSGCPESGRWSTADGQRHGVPSGREPKDSVVRMVVAFGSLTGSEINGRKGW